MEQEHTNNYSEVIKIIKSAILSSRYHAATLVNREHLALYYDIGKYISENSRLHFWGTNALETISAKLQQELIGLRGFSAGNMRKMRIFYEQWQPHFTNCALPTHNLSYSINCPIEFRALPTHEIEQTLPNFLKIGFTHHYEILNKTTAIDERMFYIERCATEFWSVDRLRHQLKSNLFAHQGTIPNNFKTTISDADLKAKALLAFKDEYLLDYINIESPDDELDERLLESGIVTNIKNFIMSLGKDFSFIGNQYRLIVEEQEYFIDLLFYNRQLQCLVAIELKRGEFKPEYLGKMNFYLSALDDLIRLPHENCSIGIILCKSHKKSIVEYAFRDIGKPMGVATFKTELPQEYKEFLPDAETLRQLL